MRRIFRWLIIFLLVACQPAPASSTSTPLPPTPAPTRTPAPTVTPIPPPTRAPTLTPEPTISPTTAAAYAQYTVAALRARAYGDGQIEIKDKLAENAAYSQYAFTYPSDGVIIYGYANIPHGAGPFPVIIMLHGSADPQTYTLLEQDTEFARLYAQKGYIVLHPNYRNFLPSGEGENLFLAGYAIDVLNLIALVKNEAGQPDRPFQLADPQKIGLWAFSMGGAVGWRVLVVSPDVKAAFFYSPMSADDLKNANLLSAGPDAQATLAMPEFVFMATSPKYYFQNITAAIDIHHGTADSVIPVEWSRETCDQLQALEKTVNCYFYDGADHSFSGNNGIKIEARMVNFFNTRLKNAVPDP